MPKFSLLYLYLGTFPVLATSPLSSLSAVNCSLQLRPPGQKLNSSWVSLLTAGLPRGLRSVRSCSPVPGKTGRDSVRRKSSPPVSLSVLTDHALQAEALEEPSEYSGRDPVQLSRLGQVAGRHGVSSVASRMWHALRTHRVTMTMVTLANNTFPPNFLEREFRGHKGGS